VAPLESIASKLFFRHIFYVNKHCLAINDYIKTLRAWSQLLICAATGWSLLELFPLN